MKIRNVAEAAQKLARVSGAVARCALTQPRRLPALCQRMLDYDAQCRAAELQHGTLERFLRDELQGNGSARAGITLPLADGARTIALGEALTLCMLVSALQARTIFEIGTYRGWTSHLLAAAAGPEAQLFTLDLRPGEVPSHPVRPRDLYELDEGQVGEAFQALPPEAAEIVQLWGDSAVFDFSPWKDSVDMVFIDGAHAEAYVRSDTARAFEMARDGGLIVWHDLKHNCPGVARVLRELGRRLELFHVDGTSLVLCRVLR